ncbi:MAG: dienelactone hydrolase family protein [Caldilineaceae bacterium]
MPTAQPDGYLALPPNGQGSPVLVLHAWWGLNDTIRNVCNRLAEAGFVVFAPDLYHGKVTDTIEGAESLSNALDSASAKADLAAAVAFLAEHESQVSPAGGEDKNIAVVGFSLGASFALHLSDSDPRRISAVVVFYGTRPGDYNRSRAVYLGHFAEQDEFEPQSEVEALEEALRDAGRLVTFYQYPGTGHWFFEPDRTTAYDAAAAELAWDRTLAFLKDMSD